ncbi:MAG: AAA family ATPase, partial [Candidatus Binatia bacterium]
MASTLPGDEGAFPVLRASQIPRELEERRWLIEHLWGASAVGIIGGNPKCCKSWLALEMAVSVATGSKCLGKYQVLEPGPALIYLAEDSLPMVRARLASLAKHHGVTLPELDLHVITQTAIRLDLARDQVRLQKTVRSLSPRLLVLDPLVRLHRLDENSANEVSGLLSYLRDLERELGVALVLVHHTRKNTSPGMQAGQGLRGSGDFHAWSDSSLYLRRLRGDLLLTVEHRAASAPEPVSLRLAGDDDDVHLEVVDRASQDAGGETATLEGRVLGALESAEPLTRGALRERLSVKNERLGPVLSELEREGRIERRAEG